MILNILFPFCKTFNWTSRYLDDLLNIDNPHFEGIITQTYPNELQLIKANSTDTEAACLDLHLLISVSFVSSVIYAERDNFDFQIVNFQFLNGDASRAPPYSVNISQLIRFTIWPTNARNKSLTAKLFKQGYRHHKLKVVFFLNCNVSIYDTGLKSLLWPIGTWIL